VRVVVMKLGRARDYVVRLLVYKSGAGVAGRRVGVDEVAKTFAKIRGCLGGEAEKGRSGGGEAELLITIQSIELFACAGVDV
jgi:hypothetical protein